MDKSGCPHVQALMLAYPRLLAKAPHSEVWFPTGWVSILNALCSFIDVLLDDKQASRFQVVQVKETFGTLRFYYSVDGLRGLTADIHLCGGLMRLGVDQAHPHPFPSDAVDAAIQQAEKLSAVTCATCGEPGRLRSTAGSHCVACDACESKQAPSCTTEV
jgi:hypothetical protein